MQADVRAQMRAGLVPERGDSGAAMGSWMRSGCGVGPEMAGLGLSCAPEVLAGVGQRRGSGQMDQLLQMTVWMTPARVQRNLTELYAAKGHEHAPVSAVVLSAVLRSPWQIRCSSQCYGSRGLASIYTI